MTGIDVEVEVPESRQVTITLAPDVPVGRRVRLAVAVYEPGPPRRFEAIPPDPPDGIVHSGQLVVLWERELG